VLLLAGALAGALAVLLVGWPRGEAAPVEVSPIQGPTREQGGGATTSEAPPRTEDVIVDVAGLVKRPGVVELPGGSRIIDALQAAGGVLPRGDTSTLNLAQLLTDGQQVLVTGGQSAPGAPAPASGAPAGVPSGGLVSINSATLEQLDTLPGIGPVLAQAIIDWRAENGGFTAIEQLQEVSGIGEATYADISGLVGL
jgi:competence protein ComEA